MIRPDKTAKWATGCVLVAAILVAGGAEAAVTVTTDNTNAANIVSIDVDGTLHTSFVNVEVTEFNMYVSDAGTYQFAQSGYTSSTYTGADATVPLEDDALGTGYAALRELTLAFDAPVQNIDGVDLFVFEFRPLETSDLTITINGVSHIYRGASSSSNGVYGDFTLFDTVNTDIRRSRKADGDVVRASSISILESIPAFDDSKSDANGAGLGYLALDLDAFNVDSGEAVTSIHLSGLQTSGSYAADYDITGVLGLVAVPEPSAAAVVLTGGLLLLRRRR